MEGLACNAKELQAAPLQALRDLRAKNFIKVDKIFALKHSSFLCALPETLINLRRRSRFDWPQLTWTVHFLAPTKQSATRMRPPYEG
jgi:hypothetical protein